MSQPITQADVMKKMIERMNFLEKMVLNSRVRKHIDYTHHYRPELRCPLEPGDIVLVEPSDKFGAYEVRGDQIPEVIVPQKLHLTTDFTQTLGPLSANPGSITTAMTTFNLNIDEIGIYKIMPEDFGYRIEIVQPGTVTRFTNKTGAWNISGADMVDLYDNHYQSLIPEVMLIEDRTPITIKAVSTDADVLTNYWVRVKLYGYKLPVKRLDNNEVISRGDPRIVASVWVGTPSK